MRWGTNMKAEESQAELKKLIQSGVANFLMRGEQEELVLIGQNGTSLTISVRGQFGPELVLSVVKPL
jgi:ABC-type ATPase with predicted acetyltransferase domain